MLLCLRDKRFQHILAKQKIKAAGAMQLYSPPPTPIASSSFLCSTVSLGPFIFLYLRCFLALPRTAALMYFSGSVLNGLLQRLFHMYCRHLLRRGRLSLCLCRCSIDGGHGSGYRRRPRRGGTYTCCNTPKRHPAPLKN